MNGIGMKNGKGACGKSCIDCQHYKSGKCKGCDNIDALLKDEEE
jgi:hypothetical protein